MPLARHRTHERAPTTTAATSGSGQSLWAWFEDDGPVDCRLAMLSAGLALLATNPPELAVRTPVTVWLKPE